MQHELVTLNNQLQTLFIDAPGSTAASVQIWFRAGSALEKKKDEGIAHFLEHMFFKGTKKRPGAAIAHEVESFGGEINAFTSFDYTCYYINTPNTELNTTAEILLDMVSNPEFKQTDLEPERGVVFEEFRRSLDNPSQYSFHKIQDSCFLNGYSHPILGNEKTIKNFSRDQLINFRKSFYNLSNALLVVAGDLSDKKKITKTIESYQLPSGPRSEFPNFELKNTDTLDIHAKDTHLMQLSICLQAPHFDDHTAAQEDLALNCLGHGESSRLYQKLVAQSSIATSCGASTMFMNKGGLHYLRVIFPTENLSKVLSGLEELVVQTLNDGFSESEVQKIKNNYIASKVYEMESLESYAFSLGHSFASNGDISSEEEFINRIKKTTVSEVNNSMRRIFEKELHLSIQTPEGVDAKAVEKKLSQFQTKFKKRLGQVKSPLLKINKPKTIAEDPQVKLYQIKPGISLIYRQNTMNPTFVLNSYIKGGLSDETAQNNGIHHLISSTITKGYSKVGYLELKSELDSLSASLSSFSGKNAYGVNLHGQSEHFSTLLDHFIGTLLTPSFKAEYIKHEKEMTLSALKNAEKDPVKQCFKAASNSFFNGHPYAMPVTGEEKGIKKLNAKSLRELHQTNLNKKEILLTYCGDKSIEEVYTKLEELFVHLPARKSEKTKLKKVTPVKGDNFFKEFDREQTQIFIGIPIKPLSSKENTSLKMLTTHLSGQSSELFVEVRDRQGLCYTAQPVHFSALEGGYWGIYMASGHDKVKPAIEALTKLLTKIKDKGLNKKDFNRIKKMIAGQNLLNVQTNEDYSNIYSVTTLHGLGLNYYHAKNQQIDELTYEDFQKDVRRILSQPWSQFIVGRKVELN